MISQKIFPIDLSFGNKLYLMIDIKKHQIRLQNNIKMTKSFL